MYRETGDLKSAKDYLLKAYQIRTTFSMPDTAENDLDLVMVYENLYGLYINRGDTSMAEKFLSPRVRNSNTLSESKSKIK